MRLDKWLWAARFFKTRSLAQQAIEAGRVKLSEQRVKPAHALKVSDSLWIRVGELEWRIHVKALSERRGPAGEARKLYEETDASRAERARRADLRRWGAEPAAEIKGRPTKRDRRRMEALTSPPDESDRSR
ncbi:MAG: RNA-binding protein [Betaproteobacteria bacterium RIFCSPLOWO2_12_FULL_65_14]|nr:MAG: RNA-binding protein [Betaproteobacteria bacterium RIFCSPLOWO2_12_FULL_65_14]